MKRFIKAFATILIVTCQLPSANALGSACQISRNDSIFDMQRRPVRDFSSFARGELGVVVPSYDHFYLFIAYRTWSQGLLEKQVVEQLSKVEPCVEKAEDGHLRFGGESEAHYREAYRLWNEARARVGADIVAVPRHFNRNANFGYMPFINCNLDAFRVAADTLLARFTAYGKGEHLRSWLEAQDKVFANCHGRTLFPEDAAADAPSWLKADRKYQQAAARFYAGEFNEAIVILDQIADDNRSPWQTIAPYVAARALIRSETTRPRGYKEPLNLEKLASAEARLRTLFDVTTDDRFSVDVKNLLQFVELRTAPGKVLKRIDEQFEQDALPNDLGQQLTDFWLAFSRGSYEANFRFSTWLRVVRGNDSRAAIEAWRHTRKLPWLVAALMTVKPENANIEALIQDALLVAEDSPAYLTVRRELVRLLADPKRAMRQADELLEGKLSLTSQDKNRIKRYALQRVATLEDFARYAVRESIPGLHLRAPLVESDAGSIIDRGLTLAQLNELSNTKGVSESLQFELSKIVFTRAFILKQWSLADQALERLHERLMFEPQLSRRFTHARNDEQRMATGAMLIARYPGLVANITRETSFVTDEAEFSGPTMRPAFREDGGRENWWCSIPYAPYWAPEPGNKISRSALLGKHEEQTLLAELAQLNDVPNATDYLGEIVLEWAHRNPRDPDLPHALHMLIKSTRGGCVDRQSGLSKRMHQHLHRYFADSSWAESTPYYYGWLQPVEYL